MADLNNVIHQPVRLCLMAVLTALAPETQVAFTSPKAILQVTDGNLGAHLHKLEEAGSITIAKTFVRQKLYTYIAVTEQGRGDAHLPHIQRHLKQSYRSIGSPTDGFGKEKREEHD